VVVTVQDNGKVSADPKDKIFSVLRRKRAGWSWPRIVKQTVFDHNGRVDAWFRFARDISQRALTRGGERS
jgi:hypothetical protein